MSDPSSPGIVNGGRRGGGKYSLQVELPKENGDVEEFKELHEALEKGTAGKNKYIAPAGSDDDEDDEDEEDSSSEDDEIIPRRRRGINEMMKEEESGEESGEECEAPPPEDEPGPRFLWACQFNDLNLVKELLNQDPNLIKFQDSDGYTGLHRASYTNNPDIVKELLLRGADLTLRTVDGWQPIHSASRWNAWKALEFLLAWGADVNAGTEGGQTALHLAAFHGKAKETLQILFQSPHIIGTLKNAQDDTPKDIAYRMSKEYAHIFDILPLNSIRSTNEDL